MEYIFTFGVNGELEPEVLELKDTS